MSQFTIDQALQIAIQYQSNGKFFEAEHLYRQIIATYPDQPDALHLLGLLAHQLNRNDVAEDMIRKALAVTPNSIPFRLSLGSVLQALQRVDDAITLYQQALALDPQSADACSHLGVALTVAGRFSEAVDAFQQALKIAPNSAAANANLGIALTRLGRFDDALRAYRTAVAHQPRVPAYHAGLATTLLRLDQPEAALAACQQALALDPAHDQVRQTLSLVYLKLDRLPEAAEEAQLAAAAFPDLLDAQLNYGDILFKLNRLDDCVSVYRKAIQRFPQSAPLYNNLANALKDQGLLDDALAAFRQALTLDPAAIQFHSNFLYTLHFHPSWTPQVIFEEHRKFNQLHALPLLSERQPHTHDRTPARRLRIGYLSSQFRNHVIGLNLLPILTHHDKSQVEIFCYSDVDQPDLLTERFKQCADHWTDIFHHSSAQVAQLVRDHQVDILVDLNLHLCGQRLLVCARKPAPVQVAFAAYPGTTGLTAIDYRLTDRHLEPLGALPAPSSEIPIRLPDSFWCYHPAVGDVPINPLPATGSGYLTFGNLNNFCKLNEKTMELWALIMRSVPRSRLLLLAAEGSHRQRTQSFFERNGIAPDRIEFLPRMPADEYFQAYHRIDLGLDSFPYNGHTTSLDSFWMGVPVITLVGDTPVSRAGWCQLVNLGLPELAAKSPSEFVRLGIDLAADLPRLADLRAKLRPRLFASPLMDHQRFARHIEQAYRSLWQRWYEDSAPPAPTAAP